MVSGDAALRFGWTKAQLLEKIETGAWREETLDEQTDICYTEGREIKVENQSNEKKSSSCVTAIFAGVQCPSSS